MFKRLSHPGALVFFKEPQVMAMCRRLESYWCAVRKPESGRAGPGTRPGPHLVVSPRSLLLTL